MPLAQRTKPEITEDDLRLHVTALASEQMAGRMTGTEGARLATDYVAQAMASIGLQPAGDMGGWLQHFRFTAGVTLAPDNRLAIVTDADETPLIADQDWRPLAFSGNGAVEPATLVFAGYGILAPGEGDFAAYDSYVDLDVTDKWVLVFHYLPEELSPEHRQYLNEYADLRFKAMVARDKGARGLVVVSRPSSAVKAQLMPLTSETGAGGGSLPVVSITDASAARFFEAAGRDLATEQHALDSTAATPGFEIPTLRLAADIRLDATEAPARNVLGRLYAGDGPGRSLVAIGAHVDHIGTGKDYGFAR